MKAKEKYKFIDKAVFFPKEKILVFADVHIGFEEALNKQGIFLPRTMFKEIKENIVKIFDKVEKELMKNEEKDKDGKERFKGKMREINKGNKQKENSKLKEIIILGDLKHEFGEISQQEWHETLEFLDLLEKYTKKIILIRGNHDAILGPLAKKKKLKIKDYYLSDEICFLHGHKMYVECLDKKIKTLVLGHKHPAVTLRDKVKVERYKCFLVGKWKRKEIVILPSVFPLVEGSDIINEDDYGMAFNFNYNNFRVYVPINVDKIYGFGKMKELK